VNWLDIVFLVVIAISALTAFASGFLRLAVGLAATILAFILASWFYGAAGGWLIPYVTSRGIANLLGFFLVFFSVMILGTIAGNLLARAFRALKLSWLDRVLGGVAGVVRGFLIAVVLLMAVSAFSPTKPPRAIVESEFAPYVMEFANVLSTVTPHELKEEFRITYARVREIWAAALRDRKK